MTNGVFDTLTEIQTAGQRTGWLLKLWADDSTEQYSAEGRLLKVTQRNGWETTITYSDADTPTTTAYQPNRPIAITNHFGRKLELRYDTNGNLVKLIDPAGGEIKYTYAIYDPRVSYGFNLTSVTWQDNTLRKYLYEAYYSPHPSSKNWLTGVIDEMGVKIGTYKYDLMTGKVLSTEKANGAEKLTFLYNQDGSTSITDYTPSPTGVGAPIATTRTHRFGYAQGVIRPTSVTAPCPVCGNTAASTAYDANGNVSQRSEHDGTVTKLTYDAKNRETSRVEAFGTAAAKTYSTQWHASWNLPTLRTEPLQITAYTYDSKGNLTGQAETPTTDVSGMLAAAGLRDISKSMRARGWSYDAKNLSIGTLSNTVSFNATPVTISKSQITYNTLANPLAVNNLLTYKAAYSAEFDGHGNLLTAINENNELMIQEFTKRGFWLSNKIANLQTIYTYDKRGLLIRRQGFDGTLTVYIYDSSHNWISTDINNTQTNKLYNTSKNPFELSQFQKKLFSLMPITTAQAQPVSRSPQPRPWVMPPTPGFSMSPYSFVPLPGIRAWMAVVGVLANCPDCVKIKQDCRNQCSDTKLPTPIGNDGWSWVKCYNDCMAGSGC